MSIVESEKNILKYIQGKSLEWWWNASLLEQMRQWSGFFPPTEEKVTEFCKLMLKDLKGVDVLGSWLADEKLFSEDMRNAVLVQFELLNPFFANTPWTKSLVGKKVLVVHPFARQIEMQYLKRELLFSNPDILPQFKLVTIMAVQSLGGEMTDFKDWFAALDYMKTEIDNADYDICLIGCGAYGFPLAAHVKRQGKKAVHLGGSLQLLFGIKGKRWENPDYNPIYNYSALMNEHWVYPDDSTKPMNADKVEGACYW